MLTLIVTCAVFAIASYWFSRNTASANFFRSCDVGLNTVGLVTANITAGTGFVYLLLNGARNGLLACLLPLALLAGYRVLSLLLERVDPALMAPNFLEGCARAIEHRTASPTALRKVLIAPLLIIFLLLFAYELFATSQLLASLIDSAANSALQMAVSGILLTTTLSVCFWGGDGMLRTERLQAAIIALCLGCLLLLSALAWSSSGDHHNSFQVNTSGSVIAALCFAAVGAFNTQLYSVLNWNAVASVRPVDRRDLLRRTSYFLAGFAFLVLAIGASMPAIWGESFGPSVHRLTDSLAPSVAFGMFAVLTAGIAAITLTTTQGITMAVAVMSRELRGLDSGEAFYRDRAAYGTVLLVAVLILGAFFYLQPTLFFLLLAVVSGAEAVMPLIVLLLVLGSSPSNLAGIRNSRLWPYFVLFILAVGVNLTLTKVQPALVPFFALGIFLVSCVYSGTLYLSCINFARVPASDGKV